MYEINRDRYFLYTINHNGIAVFCILALPRVILGVPLRRLIVNYRPVFVQIFDADHRDMSSR